MSNQELWFLEEAIRIAAEHALEQMELLEPYDHHAACDLALSKAQHFVDLKGLSDKVKLTITPENFRMVTIHIEWI